MKVGIIGMGFMGETHLKAWQATPVEQILVHSSEYLHPLPEGIQGCDTLQELLDQVDVVDICTPTHTHHDLVCLAAQHGKDIICEKPLARTVEQAQAMLKACEEAQVRLLVAQVVRFFPQYALAQAMVERGDIGQVAVVRLSRASFKPGTPNSWFHDHDKSGGMMLDLMVHDFDYARWIVGEVVSVFAKRAATRFEGIEGDHALVILRHENGALSHIEGGWAYPKPLFRTSLEIAGSHGLIEHPHGVSTPISIYLKQPDVGDAPSIAVPLSPLAEDPYTAEIKHFYRVLSEGIPPRVTAHDGYQALRIATAALLSAESGRAIQLEEI